MSRVSEHLAEHHRKSTAFHKAVSKEHGGIAESHFELSKLHDGEVADQHKNIATHHEKLMKLHADQADHHDGAAEACAKAARDSMAKADQVIPDRISGITTHFPGITPVPRFGAPQRSEKPNVPIEFEKLISTGDDD